MCYDKLSTGKVSLYAVWYFKVIEMSFEMTFRQKTTIWCVEYSLRLSSISLMITVNTFERMQNDSVVYLNRKILWLKCENMK